MNQGVEGMIRLSPFGMIRLPWNLRVVRDGPGSW